MLDAPPAGLHNRVRLPTGHFTLDVMRGGQLVERMDEPNMVVVGSQAILSGMAGGSRAAPGISLIGFGSSMAPAAFGNSALTSSYTRPVEGVTYLPDGCVFEFALPAAEANGLSIGEFGLLAPDGVLFARKARRFAPLAKDINLSLVGTWTIRF